MLKIRFYYDNVTFRIRGVIETRKLIEKVTSKEKYLTGDLNFIITNDKRIKRINNEFLNHDYFTDVIAFNYSNSKIMNGEIYISIDTVRRNAHNYKISLKNELTRVMIHGTLHLCGYEDKKIKERSLMREKEDYWLKSI